MLIFVPYSILWFLKHYTFIGFHESMQYFLYHLDNTFHCIKYMFHKFTIYLLYTEGLFPGHTKVFNNTLHYGLSH